MPSPTTEWTKFPSSRLLGSANGTSPSSFQAPQPPTTTGFVGSLTSTIRKSGSPGVVPSGELRSSEAMIAV